MLSQPAVPRRWPGATFVLLGSGPSLTQTDIDACRPQARVLAVNDTYRLAPWADVLFSADLAWWAAHPDARALPGLKYALPPVGQHRFSEVTVLGRHGQSGFSPDPHLLCSGGHSGYAAINLAVHLGASRIVLLGYDMAPDQTGRHHFFGEHPNGSHPRYAQWTPLYATLLAPLAARHIQLLNASRRTAIPHVPRRSLAEALADSSPQSVTASLGIPDPPRSSPPPLPQAVEAR